MNEDRWNRARVLFLEVCDLEPPQRDAHLREVCGPDEALRIEVEGLLSAAGAVPDRLETPPLTPALQDFLCPWRSESLVGQHVGAYRLEKLHATGGMGSVYLAHRADEQYEKTVAIKVIRRGLLDEASLRRFDNERRTLAHLEHPGIARLFDAGLIEGVLPYLVMEFVDGQPINKYCDDRRLTIVQRLQLFTTVCGAVQYAHQRLIVHRDLKPGNIFVTPAGQTKLLDFGISKALSPEEDRGADQHTLTHQRLMTPEYASPEQVRGEPVTIASDVYSLGVVLYELLTGHRPYTISRRSLGEIERAVCDQAPARPSSVVTRSVYERDAEGNLRQQTLPLTIAQARAADPQRLRRRLAGDLDAILLKALSKNSSGRYPTVEQFAQDIQNFLAGRPIVARATPRVVRLVKYVRRNAAAVTAAVLIVLSLLLGIAGTTWQGRIAARQRDLALAAGVQAREEAENARVEVRKAKRLTEFLKDILTTSHPRRNPHDVTMSAVLDKAVQHVSARYGDDPEVESAVRTAIGQAYVGLGRYAEAEPQLRQAIALQADIHGQDHPDRARAHRTLGVMLYRRGDFESAHAETLHALEMSRRLYGAEHLDVAEDLNNLGAIERARGRLDAAAAALEEALRIRRFLGGANDPLVAESLNNLANVHRQRQDLTTAETLCREALVIREAALPPEHVDVLQSLTNLATLLAQRGNYADAQALFERALPRLRTAYGAEHPELAHVLSSFTGLLLLQERFRDALPYAREALQLRQAALAEDDPRLGYSEEIIARCLLGLQQFDEARVAAADASERCKAVLGADHPQTVRLQELVQVIASRAAAANLEDSQK